MSRPLSSTARDTVARPTGRPIPAAGIVALIAPALVQAFKKYIPTDYVGLTSLGVSVLLGTVAIAVTNGFHGYGWGIVLTGVIGAH